jgi:hypothetical protein
LRDIPGNIIQDKLFVFFPQVLNFENVIHV